MARIYGIMERRAWMIAEDKRGLLSRRHSISADLSAAIRSGDGRRLYSILWVEGFADNAWMPGTVRAAFLRVAQYKSEAAFAELVRDVTDVFINCPVSAAHTAAAE